MRGIGEVGTTRDSGGLEGSLLRLSRFPSHRAFVAGPSRTGVSRGLPSIVTSHLLRLMHTGRTSTPWFCGVADDLGGLVEAHRLGVEQGGAEDVGMVAFHPARGVGDLGEAGGVAFGKAVASEALDLLEGALGEVALIAALDHAFDHLVLEPADSAGRS